ncbi:hypothetical protein GE09DRAFT_384142 [Coniochaeta sp. 2T2.1]|nr:hypothetical protein GE09DRAFT_384142 [Coniochaeta sp. 2T2.1]
MSHRTPLSGMRFSLVRHWRGRHIISAICALMSIGVSHPFHQRAQQHVLFDRQAETRHLQKSAEIAGGQVCSGPATSLQTTDEREFKLFGRWNGTRTQFGHCMHGLCGSPEFSRQHTAESQCEIAEVRTVLGGMQSSGGLDVPCIRLGWSGLSFALNPACKNGRELYSGDSGSLLDDGGF